MNERERAYVAGVAQGHGSATGDQRMLAILTQEVERVANALESKEIEAAARYLLPGIERVAAAGERLHQGGAPVRDAFTAAETPDPAA